MCINDVISVKILYSIERKYMRGLCLNLLDIIFLIRMLIM